MWFLVLFPSLVLVGSKVAAVWTFTNASARVASANGARTLAQNALERALDALCT